MLTAIMVGQALDRLGDFLPNSMKNLANRLFPARRSRYLASKNFSPMIPFPSTKEYPGRAKPKTLLHAASFRAK